MKIFAISTMILIIFLLAGCDNEQDKLDTRTQDETGLEEKFSCEDISSLEDLEGLTPKYQIMQCSAAIEDEIPSPEEVIAYDGCMVPRVRKFIITEGNESNLINNKEEFKKYFTPIETGEEAVVFLVAMTHSFPMYSIKIPEGYEQVVSDIKLTSVKETENGFEVRLFEYEFCGCSTHPYYVMDYTVTKDGDIKATPGEIVFDSIDGYEICVD